MAYRANANDGLNFVWYKYATMSTTKSTLENIQKIGQQITAFNAELLKREAFSKIDIELLKKYTVDLYEEVNNLKESTVSEPQSTVNSLEAQDESPQNTNGNQQNNLPIEHTAVDVPQEIEESQNIVVGDLQGADNGSLPKVTVDAPEETAEETIEAEVEQIIEAPQVAEVLTMEEIEQVIIADEMEEPVTKLEKAEAKVEADAIKAATNPEEANDLAYKFSNTPIHDLKKAISIAKKFEFINTLFSGNVEKYAYSIHHMNNLNSGDEAFNYLHDLRKDWKWDEEDKNFQELANLIRRRYLG